MSRFNKTDSSKMLADIAEGTLSKVTLKIKDAIKEPSATLNRMIILDVITDPLIIDSNKIDYWKNVIKVSNYKFAKILPRNTVIAQPATVGPNRTSSPMFLFPFFPSHLSLPCKPGEMVWTIFENPHANIIEIGYWLCRISEPHFIDDVNHTHHPSQLNQTLNNNSIKDKVEGTTKQQVYELRNGRVQRSKEGIVSVIPGSRYIETSDEEIFEKILTNSDAGQITQYESVPRFKKRPGDIALEGSNNTLIVLGTDRKESAQEISNQTSTPSRGIIPTHTGDFIGSAGSIDIVAGRGITPTTGGTVAVTRRIIDGQELKKELEKHNEFLSAKEGDFDLIQDRSRILVSQKTTPDSNFNIKEYLDKKSPDVSETEIGDAAIVIKSDKVRIIARSDISFIVTNFEMMESQAGNIKNGLSDDSNWASITIRRNGDIIFTPSDKGYIKLGGDDATQAILCTANPATTSEGIVTSLPVASTAGGFVGTAGANEDSNAKALGGPPDLGTFSKKVLIK